MLPGRKYTPQDLIEMAWRRKWFIVVPMLFGIYGGLIVSSRIKDMYRSEMLIQVVPQRVPDSYVRSTVTMRAEDRLNALSQQVMSRTELERTINEMNLYQADLQRFPIEDVVERMRSNIALEVVRSQRDGRDADAFYVRFTYPDREIATRVTERLGALFIDLNARDRGDLADATNDFLQAQLVEARQRLEQTEKRLEQFRERNAGKLPSQLSFNMQAIQSTQLEVQALVESLARDRDRKLMLERLYNDAQAENVAPQPAPAAAAPASTDPSAGLPAGASVQQQLTAARQLLARLELRLTQQHPDVVRAKRQIRELEERESQEAAAAPKGTTKPVVTGLTTEQLARRDRLQEMRAQIESLERQITFRETQEQRLRSTVSDYQRRIEQVPGVESEMVALTRDYETQQNAYKDLLTKSEQSKVAAELEKKQIGEQFRVLDPAKPPVRPTGIARVQVNAIGAVAGLVVGLLIAAALELGNTTFRSASDVVDSLQLPVVALVSYVENDDDLRRRRFYRALQSAAIAVTMIAGGIGFWTLQLWKHIR
jgi:polysaccharide chain length determinant protein (PEP-CTERM system associated)